MTPDSDLIGSVIGLANDDTAAALGHDSVGILSSKKTVLTLGERDLDRLERSLESGNGLLDRVDNACDPFAISSGCDLACRGVQSKADIPIGGSG